MTRHYRTLDAMRGVAAIAVVCLHAKAFLAPVRMMHAYLAVDLFFGLSGLVIAHAYAGRLDAGMPFRRFMLMRLVRLYPLYLLGTGTGIVVFLVSTHAGAKLGLAPGAAMAAVGAALVMLPSPVSLGGVPFLSGFNIPAWSLIFETVVNGVAALIWRRLSQPVLAAIIVVSGVLLVVQTLAHGSVDVGAYWPTSYLAVPRTSFSFFLGVALHRLPKPAEKRSRAAWLLPLIVVPLLMPGETVGAGYDLACVLLVFPLLLYVGACVEPPSPGPFAFLGLISFAIYALHAPLLPVVERVVDRYGPGTDRIAPWGGVVLIAALVLVAWAADRLYDRPVRRWLNRRLGLAPSAAN